MPVARSKYFLVVSIIMLLLVFLGFAPTFYLRPVFGMIDQPTSSTVLPVHLILHGLALTAWFVLFCLQAILIFTHRTIHHRKVGVAGIVVALAVVMSGFYVLMNITSRRVAGGMELTPELLSAIRPVIISQTFSLIFFALFIDLAVLLRKHSHTHKRLMFIASILILRAAFSENRLFGAFMHSILPAFFPYGLTVESLLFISLFIHDWTRHKKIFAVTIIGTIVAIPARMLFLSTMMDSDIGTAYTNWFISLML
jgi:hypothetical protein